MPFFGMLRRVALIPENGILHSHRRENLKSHSVLSETSYILLL
jgi:hypothetical protein